MKIEELKADLCEMVDQAYATALEEGHHEILQPFAIEIHEDGDVDYVPLGKARRKANHAH
jgi:hypothetical protein